MTWWERRPTGRRRSGWRPTSRPDVVLLDVVLPGLDGFETCERLVPGGVGPVVVLTSTHDPSTFRDRIAASRARGFLPKVEISGSALDHLAGGTR